MKLDIHCTLHYLHLGQPLAPEVEINGSDSLCISARSDPRTPVQRILANISISGSSSTSSPVMIDGSSDCINVRELLNLNSTSTCKDVIIDAVAENENGSTSAIHFVAWNGSSFEGL